MEILEIKLDELWRGVLDSVMSPPASIKDLQKQYGLIMRFLSLAVREKLRLISVIKEEEKVSVEEYMKGAQEGILKNLHYEERRKYQELREPESIRNHRLCLKRVDTQLDFVYSLERLLQTYFKIMQTDLHISYGGHN